MTGSRLTFCLLFILITNENVTKGRIVLSTTEAPGSCSCEAWGSLYSPISNDGCMSFVQYLDGSDPSSGSTQQCAAGTLFDVSLCVCNHAALVTCQPGCPDAGVTQRPPLCAVSRSCACEAGGQIYSPVSSDNCESFVQYTNELDPSSGSVLPCPAGTILDLNTCTCNYKGPATCPLNCPTPSVSVTWYKQERVIDSFIKQDNLPQLQALTICFRFKPLVINNDDAQGGKYIMSIFTTKKKWNLGIRTNPPLSFGIAPSSYFTDGVNNAEENDLWREEHKHCFVWEKKPGAFKWYVDVTTSGQLELFRTVPQNQVTTIQAGGTIIALQEQDSKGGGLNVNQMIPGWIAQFNMYDSALSEADVLAMNMFCNEKGNVVSDDTFTIVGTLEQEQEIFSCYSLLPRPFYDYGRIPRLPINLILLYLLLCFKTCFLVSSLG